MRAVIRVAATPRTTTSPGLRLAKATRGDGRRRHLPLGPQDISSRGAPEQNRKVRMPTGIWNAATRFQTLHGPQHLQPQWRLVWHLVWLVWPPIGEDFLYWLKARLRRAGTRSGKAPRWGPALSAQGPTRTPPHLTGTRPHTRRGRPIQSSRRPHRASCRPDRSPWPALRTE